MSVTLLTSCASVQPSKIIEQTSHTVKPAVLTITVPDWYQNLPANDDAMYSIGTALSPDLQFSYDMAVMNAKAGLAARLRSEISSQTKTFQSQIGSNENLVTRQEIEKAVKNNVINVDISGYRIVKTQTVKEGSAYRTFIMIEYTSAGTLTAAVIQQQKNSIGKNAVIDSQKTFNEIESFKR